MEIGITNSIVAVITLNQNMVPTGAGGMAPVFYATDEAHRERLALLIAKATQGMVHDVEGGTYIIVRH